MKRYLDKDKTLLIKGIAIILMIIHHFFAFAGWRRSDIPYITFSQTVDQFLGDFGKICVYIYAFITGYSIFINSKKFLDWKYRLQKIISILVNYWVILGLLLLLGYLAHEPLPSFYDLLLSAFGLRNSISYSFVNIPFAWYISFYIVIVFFSPVIIKLYNRKNSMYKDLIITIFGIYIFNGICMVLKLNDSFDFITQYLVQYASILMMGYFISKYDIFKEIKTYIDKFRLKYIIIIILLITTIYNFNNNLTYSEFYLTIFYVPIFIFSTIEILEKINLKFIYKILKILGNNSLNIWLLHAVFFTPLRTFQPLAFLPRVNVLVIIWVLFILTLISIPLIKVQLKSNKIVKKTLKIN